MRRNEDSRRWLQEPADGETRAHGSTLNEEFAGEGSWRNRRRVPDSRRTHGRSVRPAPQSTRAPQTLRAPQALRSRPAHCRPPAHRGRPAHCSRPVTGGAVGKHRSIRRGHDPDTRAATAPTTGGAVGKHRSIRPIRTRHPHPTPHPPLRRNDVPRSREVPMPGRGGRGAIARRHGVQKVLIKLLGLRTTS